MCWQILFNLLRRKNLHRLGDRHRPWRRDRHVVRPGERRAPGRAGVVHEDVQLALARRDLAGQPDAGRLVGQVGRQAHARADLRELGGDLVAHLALAGRDVDLGPGLHVSSGDHRSDSPAPAGHEGGLAGDAEQI